MRRISSNSKQCMLYGFVFILLQCFVPYTNSAAVMSIDLGSEWMKVGVVSPGVPMEIALNKESKRKTPTQIAFRDNERLFGEDAQNIGLRFPANSYGYLIDLIGKTIDNPVVKKYQERFPYYEIEGEPNRNTVVFRNGDEKFTIEELLAQLMQQGREDAETFIGQPITECVLVVPGYFGQAERQAILQSAKMINLKILQLQNDYTAVALNYGIFQRKEINETAQYYVFYDMGASSTSATIVSYQLVKDKATRETNPVVSILGVAYNRYLGGLEMQLRLRDFLAKEFNAMKKTKTDVKTNARAMAKLFKEAGRVKNVLSANTEHYAQIEGLIEEIDFRVLVTREQFETICSDLFDEVPKILEAALKSAGLTLDVVNQVVIFGGGTRVPKVQEQLESTINQRLGKNLNADEAACMGSVYRAADLATGFKVKKFVTKDAVLFPLQVVFEREGESGQPKQVKRTLFGPMNPFPQKKVITFNKHTTDFNFDVNYADLDYLSSNLEIESLGKLNLAKVSLSDVAKILEENKAENTESKGIKVHFNLDDSGLLALTNVELVFEKNVIESPEPEEEGTFSKLGSTISKLFQSSDDAGEPADSEGGVEDNKTADSEQAAPTENETNSTQSAGNDTASAATPENKTEKVKTVTIKQTIPSKMSFLYTPSLDDDGLIESKSKVKVYDEIASARFRRESALNRLEGFVIDAQDKLKQKEYSKCANENEIADIIKACSETGEWLYDDGSDATAEVYESKLDELKKLTSPIFSRHWEHSERPEALKALKKMLEEADKFYKTAANLTKSNPEKDVFTDIEIQTLEKYIKETKEWRDSEVAEQNKLPKNADVRLTVKSITEKMAGLDREVKYLVNKIKIWKPKVKEVKDDKKNETTTEEEVIQDGEIPKETTEPPQETQEEVPVISETEEGVVEDVDPSNTEEELHTEL